MRLAALPQVFLGFETAESNPLRTGKKACQARKGKIGREVTAENGNN
jgi:hypothetical protein